MKMAGFFPQPKRCAFFQLYVFAKVKLKLFRIVLIPKFKFTKNIEISFTILVMSVHCSDNAANTEDHASSMSVCDHAIVIVIIIMYQSVSRQELIDTSRQLSTS